MAAALFLRQNINLALELGVRMHGAGLRKNLAALDLFSLNTAEQNADIVARFGEVERLAEHLEARDDGLFLLRRQADDLDFVSDLRPAALHSSGCDGAAAADGHNILDRHQEGQILIALRGGDEFVDRIHQFPDALVFRRIRIGGLGFESLQSGAADNRCLIARESVLVQQIADLHLDEVEKLGIIHLVNLVHEDDDAGNAHLTGKQDMLTSLRHRAVGGGDDEDRAVHLRRAGDHVLDIVGVSGAVDMGVMTLFGLVFHVSGIDRDAARSLFRRLIDIRIVDEVGLALEVENLGDGGGQRGLAVVDMADRADVYMGFGSVKLCFSHWSSSFVLSGF